MKKTIIFLAGLIFSGACYSQSLTLEDCREMALENNLKMAISGERINQADYTVKAMKANFLPKFSLSANMLMSNSTLSQSIDGGYLPTFVPDASTGELVPNLMMSNGAPVLSSDGSYLYNQYAYFPGIDIELEVNSLFSSSLLVEQPIYMGGKVAAGYKMSQLGAELADLSQILTREEVILESDEAYWNCLRAEAMVEALELYLSTLESFYRDVTNAVEVGMKTTNDQLRVKVNLNEAQLNLMRATNASRLAQMNLCHVIGLPINQQIELAEPLGAVELMAYEGFDAAQRVEYQMLSRQIEMSEQSERVARADFLPNVGFMAMGSYSNGLRLNGEKLLDGASAAGMVSVSIPIFHWREGRNKVRAERSKSAILEMEQRDIAQKMELEVRQAYNSLVEAHREADFVTEAQAQAQENMRVSSDAYNAGRESLSNLLEAQALWQKALTDTVDVQARLRIAQTKYLKTIGRLSQN